MRALGRAPARQRLCREQGDLGTAEGSQTRYARSMQHSKHCVMPTAYAHGSAHIPARPSASPGRDHLQALVETHTAGDWSLFATFCVIIHKDTNCSAPHLQAWVKARTASDWSLFAPCLEEWVDLIQEQCKAIDPTRPAYDVCLDEFEKGMTTQQLDKIFAQVGWQQFVGCQAASWAGKAHVAAGRQAEPVVYGCDVVRQL